jgi:hypothetical protein
MTVNDPAPAKKPPRHRKEATTPPRKKTAAYPQRNLFFEVTI